MCKLQERTPRPRIETETAFSLTELDEFATRMQFATTDGGEQFQFERNRSHSSEIWHQLLERAPTNWQYWVRTRQRGTIIQTERDDSGTRTTLSGLYIFSTETSKTKTPHFNSRIPRYRHFRLPQDTFCPNAHPREAAWVFSSNERWRDFG